MEPGEERKIGRKIEDDSSEGDDNEHATDVRVPPAPDLPPPPQVAYRRPPLKRGQYAARPDEHIGVSDAQNKINTAARMGSGLSAGITFASSVVVGVLIGMGLDKRFEPHSPTPWATVVFSLLGFGAGFATFIKITSTADENIKRRQ